MIEAYGLLYLLLSAKRVSSMRTINSRLGGTCYPDALFGRIGSDFSNTVIKS